MLGTAFQISKYLFKPLHQSMPIKSLTHHNFYSYAGSYLLIQSKLSTCLSLQIPSIKALLQNQSKVSIYDIPQKRENGLIRMKLLPISKPIKSPLRSKALMQESFPNFMPTKEIIQMLERLFLISMLMLKNHLDQLQRQLNKNPLLPPNQHLLQFKNLLNHHHSLLNHNHLSQLLLKQSQLPNQRMFQLLFRENKQDSLCQD